MNDCFYCENGEKLNSLMIEVCKLDYSTVYLNRDQKHKGRCIVKMCIRDRGKLVHGHGALAHIHQIGRQGPQIR